MREFVAFLHFLVWRSRWSNLSKVHAEHVERNEGVNVAVWGGVVSAFKGIYKIFYSWAYFFFSGKGLQWGS